MQCRLKLKVPVKTTGKLPRHPAVTFRLDEILFFDYKLVVLLGNKIH